MREAPISEQEAHDQSSASAAHLLTIRAAGAISSERLEDLRLWREEQLQLAPDEPKLAQRFRVRIQQRYFAEYDRVLDDNRKDEALLNRRLASLIRRQLYAQQAAYRLVAYAIMPNHVHIVLQPRESPTTLPHWPASETDEANHILERMDEQPDIRSPLVDYLRELKTKTIRAAAELPGDLGLDWHDASFDYWIRSAAELKALVDYVADNPVSAGLVRSPEQWFFCSVHDRFLHDGETCGWLPEVGPSGS
jgi:REP element-mobilizing transposase RayT